MALFYLLLVLVLVVLIYFFYAYNRLVQLRNAAETEWAQVDVNLKKRADLIPNIIEVVKGYAKHEKDILEKVSAARSRAMAKEGNRGQDETSLSEYVAKIFLLREQYPDLKANESFLELSNELYRLESDIAERRDNYNDIIKAYNDFILKFPSNVVSVIVGFRIREMFEFTGSREIPGVDFGD